MKRKSLALTLALALLLSLVPATFATDTILIPFGKYDYIEDLFDGMAVVSNGNGEQGIIDIETGTFIIPFGKYGDKYEHYIISISGGMAIGWPDYRVIDIATNTEITSLGKYLSIDSISNGMAVVKSSDGKTGMDQGIIDIATDTVLVPFGKYGSIGHISDGMAVVRNSNWEYGIIDIATERVLIPFGKYGNIGHISDGFAVVQHTTLGDELNTIGIIDIATDTVTIPFDKYYMGYFDGYSILGDGMATVRNREGDAGIIDIATEAVIVPFGKYDNIHYISDGMAIVSNLDSDWNVECAVISLNVAPKEPIETASDWAVPHINSALEKGFVPEDIQGNYTNVITRAEFCRMAVKWVEYATGESVAVPTENPFTDTNDPAILAAYALGITAGTSSTTFSPDAQFTRQQAATMLLNTCRAIGWDVDAPPSTFADIGDAADWALPGIAFVQANGIMQGTGGNNFSPGGTYTREQSITTFNNVVVP